MKVRQLRSIGAGVLSLLMFSTLGYAAADREVRLTELENQMKQVATETEMGTYGANTALARPNVDGESWFFTFDLLFWRTKVGGTEYAYTDNDVFAALPHKGRKKHIEFDWDWGLRFGVGYNFEHDGWDLQAQYTWYDTNGSDSTRAGQNSSVIPLRGSASITDDPATPAVETPFISCASAKSMFDFEYNNIDVELGRDFYVSSTLSLRPFWGLKSAWIDQKQTTRYTGGGTYTIPGLGTLALGLGGNTVHVKESCDFWGLGPRTGVDTRWYVGNGVSIFGNVSGALLFGYFDVDHKERYSFLASNRIHLHANRHAFSPTVQFQMGLRYDTYLHNDRHHLGIGFGFEGQYWWRQNQMLKIDDFEELKYERYSEDVAFYGLTADVKFDF
ncbi:MAG: MOMP family protein [Chlamydiales bacterium]|nr:MOMP family protein [Chlamydiia bacterium]MCP5503986.1 MOMP family protein [Chlamydiales bacterium]